FFFSSRRRHTRSKRDWSSDVCSSDLVLALISQPMIVFIEDIDAIRVTEDIRALWNAVGFMDSDVTVVASAMSKNVADGPVADGSSRVRLLELDTARTMRELMI